MILKECKTKIVLQLKEIGFPVKYEKGWHSKGYWSSKKWDNTYKKKVIKPTQASVVKWFRETYDIYININIRHNPVHSIYKKYSCAISMESNEYDGWGDNLNQWIGAGTINNERNLLYHVYETHELAEEAGIIEAIKITKIKYGRKRNNNS